VNTHYFVSLFDKEQEVTVQQFVELEKACGSNGAGHFKVPPQPATHSFGKGPISGRTIYMPTLADVIE